MLKSIQELLTQMPLDKGAHTDPSGKLCLMECVAYIAGEAHSDHPACACSVVTRAAVYANDIGGGPHNREQHFKELARRTLRVAGSRAHPDVTAARCAFLVDQVLRVMLPPAMEAECPALAAAFRALPVTGVATPVSALEIAYQLLHQPAHAPFEGLARYLGRAIQSTQQRQYGAVANAILLAAAESGARFGTIGLLDQLLDIGAAREKLLSETEQARLHRLAKRNARERPTATECFP